MEQVFDLFGNDITEEVEKQEKQKKYSERAKKAVETRKKNKAEKDALFDKMFTIARSDKNLFGDVYSPEHRAEAEKYIREQFEKLKKKQK